MSFVFKRVERWDVPDVDSGKHQKGHITFSVESAILCGEYIHPNIQMNIM